MDKFFKMALIFAVYLGFLSIAKAGTCTSISRTNFSANSVLTSTDLNSQFNTVYNAANALDAGCLTDGTLEAAALNSSEFDPLLKAVKRGCKVTYSDSNTVSISACRAGVNGNFVSKSTATTATWGCGSCSAEAASTNYYVYIATGSSGTTLTPLISTTAPNADGYDGSGNFALARFRNDGSSDIDQYSIDQFVENQFVPQETGWVTFTPTGNLTTAATYTGRFKRDGPRAVFSIAVNFSGSTDTDSMVFNIPFVVDSSELTFLTGGGGANYTTLGNGHMLDDGVNLYKLVVQTATNTDTSQIDVTTERADGTYTTTAQAVTNTSPFTIGSGDGAVIKFDVPIADWAY